MADYTTTEIQTAVEKVVRSAIRRPYGALGNRNTQVTFNDLQDAASGVFILKPNAPFYTVFLGTERLAQLLSDEQEVLADLIEAVENTNRYVTEIDNLAPLNNARAALDALSNAAGSRNNLFQAITDVPAYQRYSANVQRFLDDSAKNSRRNGAIVPTPQESRRKIAGLVRDLQSQHSTILERCAYLSSAVEDYDSLNLPSLVAQGVISNARDVLEGRIEELEGLTPKQRLEILRDTTLDVLVGRAAVSGLGSLKSTTTFAILNGSGSVFADETHPATPASLTADLAGPYPIYTNNNLLDFTLDGAFTFQVPVPGSFVAFIDSSIAEPYVIVAGKNDEITIRRLLPGLQFTTTVTLTAGTRTADEVVADINAGLPGASDAEAAVALQTLKFVGVADADATGSPSDIDFVLPAPGDWGVLGVKRGHTVRVTDPLSANFGAEYTVATSGVNGDTLTCNQVSGPAPTDESLIELEVGVGKTVRIRIKSSSLPVALTDRYGFSFPTGEPQSALEGSAVAPVPPLPPDSPPSLGFLPGAQIYCRATSAAQVAQDVPRVASTQTGGAARLTASTVFEPTVWSGLGRTDPDNINKLIAYKLWARGDVPAGQLSLVVTVAGGSTAGVVVGDILVIRETPVSADQNIKGTVLSVTDTAITVDMDAAVTGGSDLQLEVGPDITLTSEYLTAVVTESASQDGEYNMDVRGYGTIPFEFIMEESVPFNRDFGGRPVFFSLGLGYNKAVFSSVTTDLSTRIQAFDGGTDSAHAVFFSTDPIEAVGTTTYFQIPENPKSLQLGDTLEFYLANYGVVALSREVVGLELSSLLIELAEGIDTDFGSIDMSAAAQIPFARIRLTKKNNYTVFKEALDAWLDLSVNKEAYFVELQRLINPLVVNENPTAAAVNTAKQHLQQLLGVLTRTGAIGVGADPDDSLEAILMAYQVDPVEEVDVLVDTYLQRGATRGTDILLQGRFSDFFGLTPETMSYDGAARKALRDVQIQDLPIRKAGRNSDLGQTQTVAEWEDPDFEYDQSDVEDFEDIEIPGDFDEILPPGR